MIDLRHALFVCCLLVPIGCFLMLFVIKEWDLDSDQSNLGKAGVVLVTYLGVVACFELVYMLNPWLFPTVILGSAFSICNIFSRFISIFSSPVGYLPHPYPIVILLVYSGICCLLSFLLKKPREFWNLKSKLIKLSYFYILPSFSFCSFRIIILYGCTVLT